MKKIQNFKIIDNKAYGFVVMSMLLLFLFVGNVSAKNIHTNISANDNEHWYKKSVSDSIVKVRDTVVDTVTETVKTNSIDTPKNNNSEKAVSKIKQFEDIENNPYKYAINVLQEKKIVQGYGNKYFPWNHVRMSMLLKVLINSYRSLTDFNNYLDSDKCISTAYDMWLLYNFDNAHIYNEKLINYIDFKQILQNFAYQYPSLVNTGVLWNIPDVDAIVTKDKMAYYLVNFLSILPNNREWSEINKDYYFKDTAYHPFGEDVEFLAKKWIISVRNDHFFIDQFASRADLVVLMSNTLLFLRDENLSKEESLESNIVDVVSKEYEPNAIYANENWLLDYLLETKRWKTYLYPQRLLSKHEAFYTLWLAADKNFNYNITDADHENITRWELAHAILDAFDFSKAYKYQSKQLHSDNATDWELTGFSADKALWFISKVRHFFSSLWEIRI